MKEVSHQRVTCITCREFSYNDLFGLELGSDSQHCESLRVIIVKDLKLDKNRSLYEQLQWVADQFNLSAAALNFLQCKFLLYSALLAYKFNIIHLEAF